MDRLKERGTIKQLVHFLAKYSEKVMLVLSRKSNPISYSKEDWSIFNI